MWRSLAFALICLAALAAQIRPAHALQFEARQVSPSEVVLIARGPVSVGDVERLGQALAAIPPASRLLALELDSPGGVVDVGRLLAQLIRDRKLPVVIPHNAKCASICFFLFAASPRRIAASDALIGVHSANESGTETETASTTTLQLSRDATAFGVPPEIVMKMMNADPGRMEWLQPADLQRMGVAVYNGDELALLRPPAPEAPPSPLIRAAILPYAPPPSPADAAAGRDERRAWETWLASLRNAYREGAVYAQSQIGAAQPASCYGPNNANRGDFTMGCTAARQRLAPVEARLHASPAFTAGWNAPVQPAPVQPANVDGPVEQQYRGAYFCAAQVTQFSLKVFAQAAGPRRRALFAFGTGTAAAATPHGAFVMEGTIAPNGGDLTLAPVSWVSQPQGFKWFGLSGRSDDGGRTFTGRVTESGLCTRFTLARTRAATAGR